MAGDPKYTRYEDWAAVKAAGMDAGRSPLKPWDVPLELVPVPEPPRDRLYPGGWTLHGERKRPRSEEVSFESHADLDSEAPLARLRRSLEPGPELAVDEDRDRSRRLSLTY